MLFNSYVFLIAFLPLCLVGYFALSRWRMAGIVWLVICSLFFYAYWKESYLPLLLVSVCFNYGIGLALQRDYKKPYSLDLIAGIGVAVNLLALFYYKYLYHIFACLNAHHFPIHLHERTIALPLGISFFTFTQIGYLLDCRSGIAKGKNFFEYALFVTFFPHLISGPILHHREMLPQFSDAKNFKYDTQSFSVGITLFTFGLAKKLIIADPISPYVNEMLHNSAQCSMTQAWLLALAYALQLYFDFSGYSDMAIGLAKMFGFKFPANFNSPLQATSIIDFWQRWHMTLTRYLNLYLFNPMALAITRHRVARNLPVGKASTATLGGFMHMLVVPTMITILLAGAWHGAGFQYLFYGLIHGVYLVVNHAWRVFGPKHQTIVSWRPAVKVAYKFFAWALTFVCVIVSFLMFRAEGYHQAIALYKTMFGITHGPGFTPHIDNQELPLIYITMAVALAIALGCANTQQILSRFEPVIGKVHPRKWAILSWSPSPGWAVACAGLFVLTLMHMGGVSEFLYFQF
ncbi:MAG: MBOAT family protein [Alphaproteobacteria bacterium]|nr:MBOAT family protein [Alphaproteobacteria bacterium]